MSYHKKVKLKDLPKYTTFNDGVSIYTKYDFDEKSGKFKCMNCFRSELIDGETMVIDLTNSDKT